MAHVVLTVNGRTLCDQPWDQWQQRAPEEAIGMLTPTTTNREPWSMPTLGAIMEANLQNRDITIHVNSDSNGFIINATYE